MHTLITGGRGFIGLAADLAATIAACFENPTARNALWGACGPNILSTNATLALLMQVLDQRRPVIHLPLPLVNAAAALLEYLPHPPLTRGLIAFTQFENISRGQNAAAPLGLTYRSVNIGVREVYGLGKEKSRRIAPNPQFWGNRMKSRPFLFGSLSLLKERVGVRFFRDLSTRFVNTGNVVYHDTSDRRCCIKVAVQANGAVNAPSVWRAMDLRALFRR